MRCCAFRAGCFAIAVLSGEESVRVHSYMLIRPIFFIDVCLFIGASGHLVFCLCIGRPVFPTCGFSRLIVLITWLLIYLLRLM